MCALIASDWTSAMARSPTSRGGIAFGSAKRPSDRCPRRAAELRNRQLLIQVISAEMDREDQTQVEGAEDAQAAIRAGIERARELLCEAKLSLRQQGHASAEPVPPAPH